MKRLLTTISFMLLAYLGFSQDTMRLKSYEQTIYAPDSAFGKYDSCSLEIYKNSGEVFLDIKVKGKPTLLYMVEQPVGTENLQEYNITYFVGHSRTAPFGESLIATIVKKDDMIEIMIRENDGPVIGYTIYKKQENEL